MPRFGGFFISPLLARSLARTASLLFTVVLRTPHQLMASKVLFQPLCPLPNALAVRSVNLTIPKYVQLNHWVPIQVSLI